MPDGRWTEAEIRCAVLWRMVRRHGCATWMIVEDLMRAVPSHERGRARDLARDLTSKPFVDYQSKRGFKIENGAIDTLAEELRDVCGFSELRIEATLSHFGGFE